MSSSAWLAITTLFVVVGIVTLFIWITNKMIAGICVIVFYFIEPVHLDSIDRIYSMLNEFKK